MEFSVFRLAAVIITVALCTGCRAIETHEAKAWIALHAVDTIQTYHAAQDSSCYKETDSLTSSLIGELPSSAEVIAWSVGMAGIHLGVTELLLHNDYPRVAKLWQYVRIGVTASAVAQNHTVGIRIGSPNRPKAGYCLPSEAQPKRKIPRAIG